MYTLDELEEWNKKKKKKRTIWTELRALSLIALVVFISYTVFTNSQLFLVRINAFFAGETQEELFKQTVLIENEEQKDIQRLHNRQRPVVDMDLLQEKQISLVHGSERIEQDVSERLDAYAMHFNTLPADNRVILPGFGVNVPLIDSLQNKPLSEIDQGDFDTELYKGVVKYPTTANPGSFGNSLIFGHTSYESWKNNAYATVFQVLPQLKQGDVINTVWNGRQYSYIVEVTHIVNPNKVNDIFLEYNDDAYLTLMGCYPLGSTKQRMMVIARLQS